MQIQEHAFAKLNLSLDILRKMEDGYHEMSMVMQSISLCDDVTVSCEPGEGSVTASTNLKYLPVDEKNIAVRAARLFFAHTGISGYDTKITLKKRIPVCAGMGGGSADGAAVLRGLNSLFRTGLDGDTLRALAVKLGSDVPFCIQGGTVFAGGRGEVLTPLPAMPSCGIVVCKPSVSISTPQLFSRIRCEKIRLHPDTNGILDAITKADLNGIAVRMYNVFETVLPQNAGQIGEIKSELLDHRALGAVMTGSGSAVFGLFETADLARQAWEAMRGKYRDCFLTAPQDRIPILA